MSLSRPASNSAAVRRPTSMLPGRGVPPPHADRLLRERSDQTERRPRRRRLIAWLVPLVPLATVHVIGWPYYLASMSQRVRHPLHAWLKPSGYVGQAAGILTFLLFLFMWLYPLRKRFAPLGRLGSIGRWLDVHIAAGLVLPLIGAVHAGWRFNGVIGLGYAAMLTVCASGVVGRYLYTRIPRSRSGIELSLEQVQAHRGRLVERIAGTTGLDRSTVERQLSSVVSVREARGITQILLTIVADDLARWRGVRRLVRSWRAAAGDRAARGREAGAPRGRALPASAHARRHAPRLPLLARGPSAVRDHGVRRRDDPRRRRGRSRRDVDPVSARGWSMAGALTMMALIPVGRTRAQVSPGALSRAHASLDDNGHCLDCHGGGASSLDRNCLACHAEIRWLVERGRGFHGRDLQDSCAGCHPEHAGRDFRLVEWPDGAPERFDHASVGWPLQGRHRAAACRDCHRAEYQVSPLADMLERRDAGTSFLGLDRACASCHADYHRETLGAECQDCHTIAAWKPAARFDHGRTAFPLDGKHASVSCDRCHLVPGRVFIAGDDGDALPRYKPVPSAECSACHDDVHRGRLGAACSRCHVTESFAAVDRIAFDHAKTRYPLRGRHARVECARCHDPQKAWGKQPPFAECRSCHEDAHAGRATLAGRVVDCVACHDERGFAASTYTVEDHRGAAYRLEGRHVQVACDRCHVKNPSGVTQAVLGSSGVLLRPRHERCAACHTDAHAGQLAHRADGGSCETCHTVAGWQPSLFTRAEHASLALALDGRHAEVECSACHGPQRRGLPPLPGPEVLGSARIALHPLDARCGSCHFDPHHGRFEANGARPFERGCASCHGTRSFRPSAVDAGAHARFTYALAGAHRAVPCAECHEDLTRAAPEVTLLAVEGVPRTLLFERKHDRCDACHRSPHGDQFAHRQGGGGCEGCHGEGAFRPADRFDHERDARFALDGAHRNVRCERCHPSRMDDSGRARTVYRPLPHACRDCHGQVSPRHAAGLSGGPP
jgi:hypothetical protein